MKYLNTVLYCKYIEVNVNLNVNKQIIQWGYRGGVNSLAQARMAFHHMMPM